MDDDQGVTFQDADYPRGSIRKIIFHDFLTYNHVECIPGPSMNVIVGPNGTGKSTIICGICLASGGTPKFLGRSDKAGDFIRHGKLEGYVEMYLKDDDAEEGLRRFKIVLRKPNNSTFYVDDKRVTHADHTKAIEKYNIQVGNPCTFLAQDKVKSFAEQDPQSLLLNTEKASDPELIKLHTQLEEKYKAGNEMDDIKKQLDTKIKRIEDDIARVRPLANNYIESQRRNAHIHTFKAKKACLVYDAAEKEFREKQQQAKLAHDVVKDFNQRKGVFEAQIRNYKDEQRSLNLERDNQSYSRIRSDLVERVRRLRTSFETDALSNAHKQYLNTKSVYDNWERELENAKALTTQLREKYESLSAHPPDNTELNEKEKEYFALKQAFGRDQQEIDSEFNRLLYKKREIENRKNSVAQTLRKKMETLANYDRNPTLLDAWDFYTRNRDQFQFDVYVPYLFISTEENNVIFLNNTLSRKDLSMFIFACYEDEKLMQQRFAVNSTVMLPDLVATHSKVAEISQEMIEYGFIDYVSNLFSAPPPVKAYFNSVSRLNSLPVGGDEADKNSENIAHALKGQVGVFLTKETRVNVVVSKYSDRVTVNRAPLRREGSIGYLHTSKLRNVDENTDQLERNLEEIGNRRTALEGRRIEIERLDATVFDLKKRYTQAKDTIESAKNSYQKALRAEKSFDTNKPDLEQAKKAYEEHKRIAKDQIPREVAACVKLFKEYKNISDKTSISSLKQRRLVYLQEIAQEEIGDIVLQEKESVETYQMYKREEEELRESFLNTRNELKDVAGIPSTSMDQLKKEEYKKLLRDLQAKFQEYKVPDTLEACDAEIQQEEIRISVGNLGGSKDDVRKLAALEKEHQSLVSEMEKNNSVIENWEGDMNTLLQKWLTPLRALVNKISENFINFFSKIQCAGEVRLSVPDNPLNIQEYGIDIYVRFRSYNQLRRLTAQQQSGGERSVSTMLYLMALQELCPVPFRCVDEINQGMDPTNERLVFNMMVELLSGDTGHLAHTQYFMLTPKLLPGLKFSEKVSVLMIHNSAFLDRGSDLLNVRNAQYEIAVQNS